MIQKKYGFGLALGRHSIMNGLGIPMSASREELDAGVRELIAFSLATCELSDWGILRVRELFESVPAWSDEELIPISEWQKKFKSTRKTSLEAFRLYYGVDLLLDLQKKVGNDA